METRSALEQQFGVLMTLDQLAKLLDRSREGLRVTMHSNSELGTQLQSARIKVGRRIHFKTALIAKLLGS
jgi:polysaccharide pyruvyl transferase WcaK-like protein